MHPARKTPELSELLGHAAWLRVLVAPLLGDAHAIDDVLQETWIAALENPLRDEPRRRGWLASIAWKRAQRARRDAVRRLAREAHAAKPELVPAADRVAAEVELQAKLAALVLALERPYRQALLLRFYEGLPPRAIAAELDAPVATVKTWLRRGLEQLRAAIAAELGTDWRGALAPLALTAPVFGALASTTAFTALGVFMQAKLVVGVLALGVLGTWLWMERQVPAVDLAAVKSEPSSRGAEGSSAAEHAAGAASLVVREAAESQRTDGAPAEAAPARDFLVEVLDPDGTIRRDIGVHLNAVIRSRHGTTKSQSGRYGAIEGASDGRIRIPASDVADVFEQTRHQRERAKAGEVEIEIECDVASVEATRHVIAEPLPPTAPIALRVAASGRVSVEIVEETEQALAIPLLVILRTAPREVSREDEKVWRHIDGALVQTKTGRAVFPCVQLGGVLRIEVIDTKRVLAERSVITEGPVRAGDEVRVRVSMGESAPLLVARFHDESGRPIASSRVSCFAWSAQSTQGTAATTDAAGRFELPWDEHMRRDEPYEALSFRLEREGLSPSESPQARIPAPQVPKTGRVDIGAIALRKPFVLAAGVVVDGEDQPLPGAWLDCASIWPISVQGPFEEHRALRRLPERSDDRGCFRLVASEACRGVLVSAGMDGYYLERAIACEGGREDVKIVLRRGATLTGNVLVDAAVPAGTVGIDFVDSRGRSIASAQPEPSGSFALRALRPSAGSVVVRRGTFTLARIDAFDVAGEAAIADARLKDIDLRGRLRQLRIRVLEATGGGFSEDRRVLLGAVDGQEGIASLTIDPSGRGKVWIPTAFDEVMLGASGHVPVRFAWTPEEQTVSFAKRHRLVLELDESTALPVEHHLRVALRLPEVNPLTPLEQHLVPSRRQDLLPGTPLRLDVPSAGSYELRVWVRSKLLDREEYAGVKTIEIGTEPGEQLLRVAPSADDLQRALAKLR